MRKVVSFLGRDFPNIQKYAVHRLALQSGSEYHQSHPVSKPPAGTRREEKGMQVPPRTRALQAQKGGSLTQESSVIRC